MRNKRKKGKSKKLQFKFRLKFRLLLIVLLLQIASQLFLKAEYSGFLSFSSYALEWTGMDLMAESGIIMDVDTGAILFEKNGKARLYPASTTKIMTALVVLGRCGLGDLVTFSHDAVYNVERGSSNAEIDEGDVLTVSDCLFAMLLKSANEAANALSEHVAGSREAFAELMTAEAANLGCTDTHFINPSGFYSADHYTNVRDMALIGAAAMNNPAFMEIDTQTSHTLAPTRRVPEGKTVYMEHKMLNQKSPYYDERVVAGKTGYTLDCGNTLVTLANYNGRRLVAVVLRDKNPYHYVDTKGLLNIGFWTTENLPVPQGLVNFDNVRDRLVSDGILDESASASDFSLIGAQLVSVPMGSQLDGLYYELEYNLPGNAPEGAIARLNYIIDGRIIGKYYISKTAGNGAGGANAFDNANGFASNSQNVAENQEGNRIGAGNASDLDSDKDDKEARGQQGMSELGKLLSGLPILPIAGAAAALGIGTLIGVRVYQEKKRRADRLEKRRKRLEEMEISEEEFRKLVEEKKQGKIGSGNDGEEYGQGGQNISGGL